MNLIKDTTIYLRITGLCNVNCKFCYRDSIGVYGPSLQTVKETIDKLKQLGFVRLSPLGGEIFLRSDWEEILAYAHKKGFELIVPSNGLLVSEDTIGKLNKYVTWFGLPLDGSSSEKSSEIRENYDQFKTTTELLKKFKQKRPKFKVRLSTLVTKINKRDLIDIGKLLFESDEYYKPDGWRLLKFLDLSEGKNNSEKYHIPQHEFEVATNAAINRFGKKHKVSCSNSTYLVISAESRLLISKENKYIDLGEFKKMSKQEFIDLVGKDILSETAHNSRWRH